MTIGMKFLLIGWEGIIDTPQPPSKNYGNTWREWMVDLDYLSNATISSLREALSNSSGNDRDIGFIHEKVMVHLELQVAMYLSAQSDVMFLKNGKQTAIAYNPRVRLEEVLDNLSYSGGYSGNFIYLVCKGEYHSITFEVFPTITKNCAKHFKTHESYLTLLELWKYIKNV